MSTVDTSDICPRCHGHTGLKTPQCNCEDRENPLPWPRPSSKGPSMGCDVEDPPCSSPQCTYPDKVPGRTKYGSPCPKCESPYRTRLERQEGIHVFCHDCGYMERDLDSLPFQVKLCRSCGQVPKARVEHDMPEDNTLDITYMTWQCCGIKEPVWPSEVLFWCHIHIAQEER